MKRLILLAMMVLPAIAIAQLPHYTKITNKYNGVEGATVMTINKQMMSMLAINDPSLDMVDEITILLSEDATIASGIVDEAKKAIKKSKIEELASQTANGSTFMIYTKREGNKLTDIVVIIENEKPAGFIVISGNIPEDKINEIVKVVNK